jgi:hypothetical protein
VLVRMLSGEGDATRGADFSASLQSPLPDDFVIDFLGPDTQETIESLSFAEAT